MTEADYWVKLMFRLSRELAGMEENHLRFLWCDGFVAERYFLDGPGPRITGRTWIIGGASPKDRWEFTLFLSEAVRTREEISWVALLPPHEMTGWLGIDLDEQRIRITPSLAVVA